MRASTLIALVLSAAAVPMSLANEVTYDRRELYDLIARTAPPAGQEGSQAFGLWSLLGDGLKGVGDLLGSGSSNNNNQKSRELTELIARHYDPEYAHHYSDYEHHPVHYGGGHREHRFHELERERRLQHFHEHEREHRFKHFHDHEREPERYHRPARRFDGHEGLSHPGMHAHRPGMHAHRPEHYGHGHMDGHHATFRRPTDAHRQVAREIVDVLAREAEDQSQALSFGSIFNAGKDIFKLFDHHSNSSRRALPGDF